MKKFQKVLSKKRLGTLLVEKDAESTSETLCFPNVFTNYINVGSLTDEQKYNVLCNIW